MKRECDFSTIAVSRHLIDVSLSSTCYQSKLTKHLNVCNAKRELDAQPAFIVKGTNLDEETIVASPHVPLSQLDESVLETVIRKIHSAYSKII